MPALESKLEVPASPEVQRRISRLLQSQRTLLQQPELLQAIRAIAILEQTRTAESEALLERLAKGQAEARITREAVAALARFRALKVSRDQAPAAPRQE